MGVAVKGVCRGCHYYGFNIITRIVGMSCCETSPECEWGESCMFLVILEGKGLFYYRQAEKRMVGYGRNCNVCIRDPCAIFRLSLF